jgi:hypothetical protein
MKNLLRRNAILQLKVHFVYFDCLDEGMVIYIYIYIYIYKSIVFCFE